MDSAAAAYLWMGRSQRRGWNAWLEFPGMTSHAALVEVAERLCRDFDGVVIERYPEHAYDDGKEYWWVRVGAATLMLMRKPPDCPVGLAVDTGDLGLLVRIGRTWGVERYVGWRWHLWRAWRRWVVRQGP